VPEILGRNVDLAHHPHGSNVYSKLNDADVASDPARATLIQEIAGEYLVWRDDSAAIKTEDEPRFVEAQMNLYERYRNVLDEPRTDVFDSRGALQPSALEEFCYLLFAPLLRSVSTELAIGHFEVYQGMYFSAQDFRDFATLPTARYPVGNLDFVIGKPLTSRIESDQAQSEARIVVPAVAVECKTYLDRPRWIESDVLATRIKAGFPRCLYLVISEFLKLDLSKVDVIGSRVDHVYVFRREQNVDRRVRRKGGTSLTPLHFPAVYDFYGRVKEHLTARWSAAEDWQTSGIIK